MLQMKDEKDRHARMLAMLLGKKTENKLNTPLSEDGNSPHGTADAQNEEHAGISMHGDKLEGSPEEEAMETEDEEKMESLPHQLEEEEEGTEKHGRLFGHPKKAVHITIAVGKK